MSSNPFDAPRSSGAQYFNYKIKVEKSKHAQPDTPKIVQRVREGDEYTTIEKQDPSTIKGWCVGAKYIKPNDPEQQGIIVLLLQHSKDPESPIAQLSCGASGRFGTNMLTLLARGDKNGILGKEILVRVWSVEDKANPKAKKKFGMTIYDLNQKNAEGKPLRLELTDDEFKKAQVAADQKRLVEWWDKNISGIVAEFEKQHSAASTATAALIDADDDFIEKKPAADPAPVDDLPF